jgi:hypothetical protein
LGDNAATDANIARDLTAGERMRVITGMGWKIDGVAWALGLLPGRRPF